MKNLKEGCYNPVFSHIYVEKDAWEYPRTRQITDRFHRAKMIEIEHYKDLFCRRGQDCRMQHRSQNLILAVKRGKLIYEGAPVCQSFGNKNFYYTSCVMNCVYDCDYCYLKGIYPSGNIVVFVNLEDFFSETKRLLDNHPVYLCISYDTDLMALEPVVGYVKEWMLFAEEQTDLKLELRTKSANKDIFSYQPVPQMIYAFTLSPQAVIDACEDHTPSLKQRIDCVKEAIFRGCSVRLCFDPMIYCKDWEMHYDAMLKYVYSEIDTEKLLDVSVGTFRISQDYLKNMRKNEPDSAVAQFPYQNIGGVYQYPKNLSEQMEKFLFEKLKEKVSEEKIFFWETERCQ